MSSKKQNVNSDKLNLLSEYKRLLSENEKLKKDLKSQKDTISEYYESSIGMSQELEHLKHRIEVITDTKNNYKLRYEEARKECKEYAAKLLRQQSYDSLILERDELNCKVKSLQKQLENALYKNGELLARNAQLAKKATSHCGETNKYELIIANLKKALQHYDAEVDANGNLVQKASIWDGDVELGRIPKTSSEDIVFRLVNNEFGIFIDSRVFKYGKPTRKGLCLRIEKLAEFSQNVTHIIDRALEVIENE